MNKELNLEEIETIRALISKDTRSQADCVIEFEVTDKNGHKEIVSIYNEKDKKFYLDDIEARKEVTKKFQEIYIKNRNHVEVEQYDFADEKDADKYFDLVEYEETKNSDFKKIAMRTAIGIGAGVAALGAAHHIAKALTTDKEAEAVEASVETSEPVVKTAEVEKVSMEGKDFTFYTENAEETAQKEAMMKTAEFAFDFNNSQDWMKYTSNEGKQAVFGVTPEEAFSFYVRFNEFTDDEMITMFNGRDINAEDVMNKSNDMIEKMIAYYTISSESSGIEALFNDEYDKEVIRTFEEHHTKMMKAEGKEKEELMREEKQMFSDYFNDDIGGNETKARRGSTSFILRSILESDCIISSMEDYKGTVTAYRIKDQKEKEVKTALFDDLFMARYVAGFEEFNEENYIKRLGLNANDYYLLLDNTVSRSIADLSCGPQEEKISNAEMYAAQLESREITIKLDENGQLDQQQMLEAVDKTINTETGESRFDELTKFTYNREEIFSMIEQQLIAKDKQPENTDLFWEIIVKKQMDKMNAKTASTGSTKNSGGKTVLKTIEGTNAAEGHAAAVAALQEYGIPAAQAEAMTNAAETEAAHKAGAVTEAEAKVVEQEAATETRNLTEISHAVFNHYAEEVVFATSYSYNSAWASDKNPTVRQVYQEAKAAGLDRKAQRKAAEEENKRQEEARRKAEEEAKKQQQITDPTGAMNETELEAWLRQMEQQNSNTEIVQPVTPVVTPTPTPSPAPVNNDIVDGIDFGGDGFLNTTSAMLVESEPVYSEEDIMAMFEEDFGYTGEEDTSVKSM